MVKSLELKDVIALVDTRSAIMTIEINKIPWDIYLKDQTIFKQATNTEDYAFFGLTVREKEEIWLWDGIRTKERMYKTIKHELVHAYIDSFGMSQHGTFTEEQLADFVESYGEEIASAAKQILKIVQKAKKN